MNESEILDVLDACAGDFVFPMLDNGYVYPAAVRLTAFQRQEQWALAIEVLGVFNKFIDPVESITTDVHCFGNCLQKKQESDFVTPEAHQKWLDAHPFDGSSSVSPIEAGPSSPLLADPEDWFICPDAEHLRIRGGVASIPRTVEEYREAGVELEEPPRVRTHELLRALAREHRDTLLANDEERRALLPEGIPQILQLDEWRHPDLAGDELPSETSTFRMISKVLATGESSHYRQDAPPNTDWRNWPDGGSL